MTDKNVAHTTKRPSEKDHLRALGSRIVEHRNARGWKQRELARRAGIEPGRLSRIERGIASPNLDEMFRLKAVFGGSLDELFLGEVPAGPEGSLDELARDLERLGSRDEIATLRTAVRRSALGDAQIEQALGLGAGDLNVLFAGQVELRVAHVFRILRAIGLEPWKFFLELRAGRNGQGTHGAA